MNKFNIIYMPYGFCKELRRICPFEDDPTCGINKNYFLCSKFELKGKARAIEEIDQDGKRRVRFAVAQDIKCVGKKGRSECDNASAQGLLGDRIGWQKITRLVKS